MVLIGPIIIALIIIAVVLMALLVLGVSGIGGSRRCPLPAAGPDRAAPGYRGGDIVTTVTSRDVEAAGELALARLDDDGAPPPVSWPQISDSHGHHAISRGHTGKPAGWLAETAAATSGEEAEQTPALLGAG